MSDIEPDGCSRDPQWDDMTPAEAYAEGFNDGREVGHSEFESRIAHLESQLRWIPVEERLPDFDEFVLVTWKDCPDQITAAVRRHSDDGWYWEQHHMGALTDGWSYEFDDDCEYDSWRPIEPPVQEP